MRFGICTSGSFSQLNLEKEQLYVEAKKHYDEVLLIDTRFVTYWFVRGSDKPIVIHKGMDISNLNGLHIRSTNGREVSTSILAHSMVACGCDIFDPADRFSIVFASKLLTSLSRFNKRVGSNTFITFNLSDSHSMLEKLWEENYFPLISKPITGKQGQGIKKLTDIKEAITASEIFFKERSDDDDIPLLIQSFENFVSEYRVLVIDGKSLGIVQKINSSEDQATRDSIRGRRFVEVAKNDVEDFVVSNVSNQGIVGVDVAIDDKGGYHIIEVNRAPMWRSFQKATNINVAEKIISQYINRK